MAALLCLLVLVPSVARGGSLMVSPVRVSLDRLVLQFVSSIMVPFSFPSYAVLIYSLVCAHTIGYIL